MKKILIVELVSFGKCPCNHPLPPQIKTQNTSNHPLNPQAPVLPDYLSAEATTSLHTA